MKLLVVGDTPTLQTGFARVVQNLVRRWAPFCERIDIWGIGYNGYPGKPGSTDNEWRSSKVVIYPASYSGAWYDLPRLQSLINQIKGGDYTHVWIIQDHFLLTMHEFPDFLGEICRKKGVRSYYYCPVDGLMEPEWGWICEEVDHAVAYTTFGQQEIRHQTGEVSIPGGTWPDIKVLPHGVDTMVYKSLPDKDKIRHEMKIDRWLGPDDLLMINVNANQRRKDTVRSLQILKALHDRGQKHLKLLMHMPETGPDGISLEAAGRQIGLVYGRDWRHTDGLFLNNFATISEVELNRLYNAADLYLTTTLGEGWGLGITEALAAGLPVAIPEHTACISIAEELAKLWPDAPVCLMPVEDYGVGMPNDNGRVRPRVNVQRAAKLLQVFAMKAVGRTHQMPQAVKEWMSWDRIAQEWLKLFALPAKPRHYYLEYAYGLGDVFNGIFWNHSLLTLDDLKPGENATVVIRSHCPTVHELFDEHPKRDQFTLVELPYDDAMYDRYEERQLRHKLGLPALGRIRANNNSETEIRFRRLSTDRWESPQSPYLMISATAGLKERTLPEEIVHQVLSKFGPRWTIVAIGRSYERHGRKELDVAEIGQRLGLRVISLIDQTSVPGAAELIQNCSGLITCHSAWNILGWHLKIPQLLFYPEFEAKKHFQKKDQWSFGMDNGLTVHRQWPIEQGALPQLLSEFESLIENRR